VNFLLGGNGLDLVRRVADAGQVAIVQQLKRVAAGTNAVINLEAALQIGALEGPEKAVEGPMPLRKCDLRAFAIATPVPTTRPAMPAIRLQRILPP
jgi:hypothetical protein